VSFFFLVMYPGSVGEKGEEMGGMGGKKKINKTFL
jgi:hypothetical protein